MTFAGLGRLSLPMNLQCARELLLRIKAVRPVELQTDFLGVWLLVSESKRYLILPVREVKESPRPCLTDFLESENF